MRIEALSAFVSVDVSGNEELVLASTPGGIVPMIAVDHDRLKTILPMAEQIARTSGKHIRLVTFSTREIVKDRL